MSKTVCKCGAEYEHDDPFPDEKVDACQRCSNYARAEISLPTSYSDGGARVTWAPPKKPSRLLS
jgi:hypothetical protein